MIDEKRLYTALGERLRQLRVRDGSMGKLTQGTLASDVGLERTSITNIEQGKQKVPLHVLYRICEALAVDIADVLPILQDVQPEHCVHERRVNAEEEILVTLLSGGSDA